MDWFIIYALILLAVVLLFTFRSSLADLPARVELRIRILFAILQNMCGISDFFSPEAYRKKSRDWALGYFNDFIVSQKSQAFIERHHDEHHMHITRLWRIGAATYLYDYASGLVFITTNSGLETPSTPELAISVLYNHIPHSDAYAMVRHSLFFALHGMHNHDEFYEEFHDFSEA